MLFPVLSIERLLLREIDKSDAEIIFFLRSDERVLKYLDRAPIKSIEEAIAFITGIKNDQYKNNSIKTKTYRSNIYSDFYKMHIIATFLF